MDENAADKIFVIQPHGGFDEVERTPYETEDLLQRLLEEHPELLAGDLLTPGKRIQFLLIEREIGVPDTEGGSGRWSLDHLFIDQDAIPTFVEVKRSSDTRIRREVVGQMLDYAANGQKYWSADRMRELASRRAGTPDLLTGTILDMVGEPLDEGAEERVERFWSDAFQNLKTGKVRLVFVADVIPPELKRVLEFLNEQMERIQVVGLELVQYHGNGLPRILVPRVVGQTEAARDAKARTVGSHWQKTDPAAFLADCPGQTRGFFTELLEHAARNRMETYWGKVGFSLGLRKEAHGRHGSIMYGWPAAASRKLQPSFQVYVHPSVLRPDEEARMREQVLQTGHFTASGSYTLTLPLSESTIDAARAASGFVFDFVQELTATRS